MADFSPLSTIKKLASGQSVPAEPTAWGRFALRRLLGQGARSVTWLAYDPQQKCEVILKLLTLGPGADAAAVTRWVQQARRVSHLDHPHIVPVLEADVLEQQPFMVSAYVPGHTLASALAQHGAMPPLQAVALALDVLDALVLAHAAGVLHRNLKPANVLVDGAGRAQLMDFGDFSMVAPEAGSAYLAPELLQGQPASALSDVFGVGLLLAEMLSGKPLARDAQGAAPWLLPDDLSEGLNADRHVELHALVLRALAHDPALRYPDAQGLRDALAQWVNASAQAEVAAADAPMAVNGNTMEALLARMRHKSDFPAMSDSVARIQGMASSETESVGSVTNEILKDVALTNKLLRLVNSAHFAARGGSINTVSRAVSLVGFNGIRNMALSLVLLEHMRDKSHASLLKDEFLRSLMAGAIASELSAATRESEEAFIGAMFQNLGRMLAEFYFPDEARAVRNLMAASYKPPSEATASTNVLGLSFEALGLGVAKAWGLPESITHSMRRPRGEPPMRPPVGADERLRWIGVAANEIADILLRVHPRELNVRLAQVAGHYAKTMGLSPQEVRTATVTARKKLIDMATAMELNVQAGTAAAQLLKQPEEDTGFHALPDAMPPMALQATPAPPPEIGTPPPPPAQPVADLLSAGIQDITQAMVDDFKLSDVLRMILETMFRAMHFRRIIFCMRDSKGEALTGRFGLGEGVESAVKPFQISLKPGPQQDLFTTVCLKGADTMISDATDPRIVERLPLWYRQQIKAPTFLLLPLVTKGKPFGLIYADMAEKGVLALNERELALLRTLRNQAIMAFKQSV
ncbi:HDOD domain-containing protein [Rhodoferax sp.]|uniref:HDOD domain-containing protein n=1 Tax=Rhodoferax sp. TaxID=50421 RepID=UPI00374CFD6A